MSRFRAYGPVIARPPLADAMRAALGSGLGLLLADLILRLLSLDLTMTGLLLIAPFGASAFLIFVVPNSPLAQPWSVVVGNSVAAGVALLVTMALPTAPLAAPLSVALAVLAMALTRSFHPPGGAVALATVIAAHGATPPDWRFALSPVLAGSVALVLGGLLWHRVTGRTYPFRQPAAPSSHGTADPSPDPSPDGRLGLSPTDIAALLDRLHMSPNIGVADMARAISSAETTAASRHIAGLLAKDVMSRDLVSVPPGMALPQLALLFRKHGFKSLPITDGAGAYLGLVDQSALLGLADPQLTAADLAHPVETAAPDAGIADVMARLPDGRQQALPIVQNGQLAGLITRSDLIALLAARLRDG